MSIEKYKVRSWLLPLLLLAIGLLVMIVFEANQQLYYINKFDLADAEIRVSELIVSHLRRWFVWLVIGVPVVLYVFKFPFYKSNNQYVQLLRFGALIISALAICIVAITVVEGILASRNPSGSFASDLQFFFFQKGPIYLFSYAGLIVLGHLFLSTRALDIKVRELHSLKAMNYSLYEELKGLSNADDVQFIQVKIGRRSKVVLLDDIRWIEADDYCVKLHMRTNGTYVLRSSMKSMENLLPANKFLRIHRQSIVNLTDVNEFFFTETPEVLLTDGLKLPVAQSRIKLIKSQLSPS